MDLTEQLIFSTPVWGAGHLGLFVNVCLPSLLARRNLPGLSSNGENKYLIYTCAEDEARLRAAASFQTLENLMSVEVILIDHDIVQPHRTMSDCHIDSIRRADTIGAAVIFLPPDCIWSDGSMRRLEELVRAGKSVVHMSGIRLDRDAFLPDIARYYSTEGTTLSVAPRDLVSAALRHLHPIAFSHFWNEYDGALMPANLIWTVPDEGLLLRCFHLHPLMVKSQVRFAKFESTIDDDLPLRACPDASRDYIVSDSDELLAFEMSGLSRIVGTVCEKESIEGVAAWAEYGTNERHRNLIRTAIRLHSKAVTESLWTAAEMQSAGLVDEILRLLKLSTIELAWYHQTVFAGRMYAVAMGRGAEHRGFVASLARFSAALGYVVLNLKRRSYYAVFFRKGRIIMTHPQWLIRRSTVSAIAACISPDDRTVVLIGADDGVASEVHELRPLSKIQAFPGDAIPDLTLVHSGDVANIDVVIALDLSWGPQLRPQVIGRRRTSLRLNGDDREYIGSFGTRASFGGLGTRLSAFLTRSRFRVTGGIPKNLPFYIRASLKLVGYLLSPLAFVMVAGVSLITNVFGLALDELEYSIRRLGGNEAIVHVASLKSSGESESR